MWWALTRQACEYILEFMARHPQVQEFFLNTPAPDEMFFQTIIGNSSFGSRTQRNVHYADWSTRSSHPAMISEKQIAYFKTQGQVLMQDVYGCGEVLFARKFSDENIGLVDRLDDVMEH